MTEKRYTVEMAIYKRREGSSNIGVNYIHDNYSKNNKMVKCCGRNYVDVEVPESAIVFGDTNRHIINKVCERLNDLNNENEQLKETIKELELENAKHIGDGEWDIRDITYGHGKFRLEEWGQRYHQFYNGDKQLEDEEVVSLLFESEQLKQFKENVIKWVDSQMKFNGKKYIETEDDHFKSENIDLHNFKVFIGID